VSPRAGLNVLDKRKYLAHAGISSPDRTTGSLFTIPTALSRLPYLYLRKRDISRMRNEENYTVRSFMGF
jgi:hypothetical protein